MNRVEAGQLLSYISTVDSREVSRATVDVWMGFVGDLQQRDCMEAVRRHFAASGDYLKPHHVREGAWTVALERGAQEQQALESALTPKRTEGALFGTDREPGAAIAVFVLAAVRAAGSDPLNGVLIGPKRAGDVAVQAAKQWLKAHRDGERPEKRGYTCGRTMCRCTHGADPTTGAVCEGGWLADDRPAKDRDSKSLDSVLRCPMCAEDRAKILADAPTLNLAGKSLRASKLR